MSPARRMAFLKARAVLLILQMLRRLFSGRDSATGTVSSAPFTPGIEGVFLEDRPLDCNEGAKGDELLEIRLPDELDISNYEL